MQFETVMVSILYDDGEMGQTPIDDICCIIELYHISVVKVSNYEFER